MYIGILVFLLEKNTDFVGNDSRTFFLIEWKAELAEPFKGQVDFVSTQCLAGAWK